EPEEWAWIRAEGSQPSPLRASARAQPGPEWAAPRVAPLQVPMTVFRPGRNPLPRGFPRSGARTAQARDVHPVRLDRGRRDGGACDRDRLRAVQALRGEGWRDVRAPAGAVAPANRAFPHARDPAPRCARCAAAFGPRMGGSCGPGGPGVAAA